MKNKLTYKDSGVDIDAGNQLVQQIKSFAKATKRKEVVSGIGGFSGMFSLANSNIKNPVLVAATDGVGTKLKIAIDSNTIDTIGQDLVAMCVNDLICCGAEPLFFLDYYATGKLDNTKAAVVIKSIATCLQDINCTLLGGETAEMPGMYQEHDFDLAGFAVGLVDREKIIDGSNISIGDKIIGLDSAGIHSNGFSLVRKIIAEHNLDINKVPDFAKLTYKDILLAPTTIYVNPILNLLKNYSIHGMAHITGGGLIENIPRVLPKRCAAQVAKSKIKTPDIFSFLQDIGHVPDDDMWRTFNMGVGFILIVKHEEEQAVLEQLQAMNMGAACIGEITSRKTSEQSAFEFTS